MYIKNHVWESLVSLTQRGHGHIDTWRVRTSAAGLIFQHKAYIDLNLFENKFRLHKRVTKGQDQIQPSHLVERKF